MRKERIALNIRLTHIDGKLPNLALMKLSHWHKSKGDNVYFTKEPRKTLFEKDYDIVYGSSIFSFSDRRLNDFMLSFPDAIIGGTGTGKMSLTIEGIIGGNYGNYDYSIYPNYKWSIGFTQRGCRLRCGFCVVPEKEGRPQSVSSIYNIWRGDPIERKIHLLDNDFFGQSEDQWKERVEEVLGGKFKICLNQGINIRLINQEIAYWLNRLPLYEKNFKSKTLYTAWDNFKDEKIFFRGIDMLEKAGFNLNRVVSYMLIGFDPEETEERILHRFNKMRGRGIRPYPMVFDINNKRLRNLQRWVLTKACYDISWEEYSKGITKKYAVDENILRLF